MVRKVELIKGKYLYLKFSDVLTTGNKSGL